MQHARAIAAGYTIEHEEPAVEHEMCVPPAVSAQVPKAAAGL